MSSKDDEAWHKSQVATLANVMVNDPNLLEFARETSLMMLNGMKPLEDMHTLCALTSLMHVGNSTVVADAKKAAAVVSKEVAEIFKKKV